MLTDSQHNTYSFELAECSLSFYISKYLYIHIPSRILSVNLILPKLQVGNFLPVLVKSSVSSSRKSGHIPYTNYPCTLSAKLVLSKQLDGKYSQTHDLHVNEQRPMFMS